MSRRSLIWITLLAFGPAALGAQQLAEEDSDAARELASKTAEVSAGTVVGDIRLDGRLDEEAWLNAEVASGFIQQEPVEGNPAIEDTQVRVLFGPDAIYIGARMVDSDAASIAAQLVRRDSEGQYDFFEVAFDPNMDRRTGYVFRVSAANVQSDSYLYDDEKQDRAWDAVWESEVTLDDGGWTAEIRIPLSQIRYEASDSLQTWGINFARRQLRHNERTFFALLSRLQRGTVSQFGILRGVEARKNARRLEVLPYVLSSSHVGPSEEGDPFFDGSEMSGRTGVELSYGLSANFTLDATVNPDFGQVEADPAVINLSAFETFLQERRPFFVEDARVFDFNLSGHQNQLFYSRRVGRSPQGDAPSGADFTDVTAAATILGAAKISGRTSGGLSVGVLGAVTQAEKGVAYFEDEGRQDEFLAEPRTHFGVVRVTQDFGGGASQIGGIFTALQRDLPEDGSFDFLTSTAFNAGIDFEFQWGDREWALTGFFAGSHIRGDSTAITRIQRSNNHYFQRPDATRLGLDPTATTMTGVDWRVAFARRSGRHWTGAIWAAEVTPGFEINDLGFSRRSEVLDAGAMVTYKEIEPGSLFRSYNLTFFTFHNWMHEALDDVWSFGSWSRAHVSGSASLRNKFEFLNYWELNLNGTYTPDLVSRSATRGGPLTAKPGKVSGEIRLSTDKRARLSMGANVNVARGRDGIGNQFKTGLNVTLRPSPRLELSVKPQFTKETNGAQYVTSTDILAFGPTFGRRYIFADLDRTSFSMETRLDVSFTPDLTLQLYAQPLISAVDYLSYKQLLAPETFDFETFQAGAFSASGEDVLCQGGKICQDGDTQHLDFDGDGVADASFSDRDFIQRSLVGNAVLRWEYRPGSTIFLVWQRRQLGREDIGDFDLGRDIGALFDAPSDDRFIVKVNYWLGL